MSDYSEIRFLLLQVPTDLPWFLRVDGHSDKVPIFNRVASAPTGTVHRQRLVGVQYLAVEGIPEEHMAAAGFSKFHPIDPADTSSAYQKNRRSEIKLTTR